MLRRLFILGLLLAQGLSWGCLNDRDSLEMEADRFPDTAKVITGHFERNPPLYYEMRLNRVAAENGAHPDRLAAYDDAGVAADRLGRSAEGIRWMEAKREHLERIDPKQVSQKEHWYRYYANVGTFRVHRWLKEGADRSRLAEVKRARNEIARAIEIKPDAHFGREKYQLDAMNWILYPGKLNGKPEPFAAYLYRKRIQPLQGDSDARSEATDAAIKGLSGLIVMGNAWESVDIFHALSAMLDSKGLGSLAHLARLRQEELIRRGRKPLYAAADLDAPIGRRDGVSPREKARVEKDYRRLRERADAWQERRAGAMLSRLRSGSHPDTDRAFWDGVEEKNPPELAFTRRYGAYIPYILMLLVILIPLILIAALFCKLCWKAAKVIALPLKERYSRGKTRRLQEERIPPPAEAEPLPEYLAVCEDREQEKVEALH
ncbi:MAG: hypothetical protein KY468_00115 [Armatimonadetes bacterium]|nr:hypothetical protein [Armatimonadota bacterium]